MSDLKAQMAISADASGVEAGVTKAKRSLADLGATATTTSEKSSRSIDNYIKKLDQQVAAQGKTTREAKLYELSMKGATQAQLNSVNGLLRSTEAYEKHNAVLAKAKIGAAAFAAAAAGGSIAAFKHSVDLLDKLDDLSEKTGITVEKLSELRFAGEATGTPLESLTSGLTKLAKQMAEVVGGNKEAAATFKALGVDVTTSAGVLRGSDEVLADIANRFAGYEDGAAKAALAQRAFGKSGGEMIPLLNQGAAGIERLRTEAASLGAIYTGDLAKSAAGFNDNLTKIKLASEASAIAISGPLVSSLAELSEKFLEAKKNGGIWAAGMQTYWAATKQFWNGELFTGGSAAQKALASLKPEDSNDAVFRKFLRPRPKIEAPVVEDEPKVSRGGGGGGLDRSIAQEAKARLSADLDAIKNAQERITDTLGNGEKVMEAMRAAALVDDREYYAAKLEFLTKNESAQTDALQKQIARLEQEKVTGKDKIDNAKEIADIEAQIAKVREDSATSIKINSIQETAAYQRVTDAVTDARIAAQSYLDTLTKASGRELAGIGLGEQARAQFDRRNATDDRYEEQRQTLAGDLRRNQITKRQYEEQLAIINEFHSKALAADDQYWQEKLAKQKDWALGAAEALKNYYDESQNYYKQTNDAVAGGLRMAEDELVKFVTTGKGSFKSLADYAIEQMARIAIQQTITGPLSGWLKGLLGGGGSSGALSGANLVGSFGGDALGAYISLAGLGKKAGGGPVSSGTPYLVGEKGPELFVPGASGSIVPNHAMGGSQTVNHYNFTVGDVATVSMVRQAISTSQKQAAGTLGRSQRYGGTFAQ